MNLFVKIMCGKLADKYSLKYRQSVECFRRAAIRFHFLHYNMFNILCNIVLQVVKLNSKDSFKMPCKEDSTEQLLRRSGGWHPLGLEAPQILKGARAEPDTRANPTPNQEQGSSGSPSSTDISCQGAGLV